VTFTWPANAQEFLIQLVPSITVLLGLAFFLAPARLLNYMGLRNLPDRPEAIGEGRSSFAGILLAVGLSCLLLQEPIAMQPGLNFVLALGWSIAAFGRILQMVLDGGWRKRIKVRFLLALLMAGIAWSTADVPQFLCANPFSPQCQMPQTMLHWVTVLLALLTLVLGLIALLLPDLALKIMRLEPRMRHPFGRGEPRGTLAGFHIALGLSVLLTPQPPDFVVIMLGASWLLTGVGRLVSMVFDRGLTAYNSIGIIFEIGVGCLLLGLLLRFI
jgi:hypothetical protein